MSGRRRPDTGSLRERMTTSTRGARRSLKASSLRTSACATPGGAPAPPCAELQLHVGVVVAGLKTRFSSKSNRARDDSAITSRSSGRVEAVEAIVGRALPGDSGGGGDSVALRSSQRQPLGQTAQPVDVAADGRHQVVDRAVWVPTQALVDA